MGVDENAVTAAIDIFFPRQDDEIKKIETSKELILLKELNCRTQKPQQKKVVGSYGETALNNKL